MAREKPPAPERELEPYLQQLVNDAEGRNHFEFYYLNGLTDFSYKVEVRIGHGMASNTFFPRGHQGTGNCTKKGVKSVEKKITDAELVSFLKGLIACEAWLLANCKETGVPDEGSIKLAIKDGNDEIFTRTIWEACFSSETRAKKVHELMEAIVPKGETKF